MNDDGVALSCPAPATATDTVQLAQGSGGRAMERLLDTLIRPAFANPRLDRGHDGARGPGTDYLAKLVFRRP